MTDEDVIAKIAKMLKKNYFQAKRKTAGGKTAYIVSSQARPILIYLLPRLLPHMGKRRSTEIEKCIEALEEWVEWYLARGLSEAAKEGYNKGLGKNNQMAPLFVKEI